jgi:hypothetical protein
MAISTATTAGQILTSAYVNNNINSGLVYVKSQAVGSAVASVTVSSAFSATYVNYQILWYGGACSASGILKMTIGGSTGSTYGSSGNFQDYASATIQSDFGGTAGSFWLIGTHTITTTSLNMDIFNPFASAITSFSARTTSNNGQGAFAGRDSATTSSTAFTITPQTGTMTGGTIYVYGYRTA